jgi:hypothetical protein
MEQEDLNNIEDYIDLTSYDGSEGDYSESSSFSDETRQFLEFIQAVKDDNTAYLEEMSKEPEKLQRCKRLTVNTHSYHSERFRRYLANTLRCIVWKYEDD